MADATDEAIHIPIGILLILWGEWVSVDVPECL